MSNKNSVNTDKKFEQAFIDHPVLRDLTLFLFLTLGFGIPFKLLFELLMGRKLLSYTDAVLTGLAFSTIWIILIEVYAQCKGSSILRSLGKDPVRE